jgi:hypothetical protein
MKRHYGTLLAVAFVLLAAPPLLSQTTVTWYSLDAAGGGFGSSNGNALYSSIGQAVVGVDSSNGTTMHSGFLTPIFQTAPPPSTPRMATSETSLDFGDVQVAKTKERTLIVSNTGLADLILTVQRMGGTDSADFSIPQGAATTIAPGGSSTMRIACTPRSLGSKTAVLRIASNDPLTPQVLVTLSSRAITTAVGDVPVAPTASELRNVYPNPIDAARHSAAIIEYALESDAEVVVAVYDAVGREVALLDAGPRNAGSHQTRFLPGAALSAGKYTVVLRASHGGSISTRSRGLLLLR